MRDYGCWDIDAELKYFEEFKSGYDMLGWTHEFFHLERPYGFDFERPIGSFWVPCPWCWTLSPRWSWTLTECESENHISCPDEFSAAVCPTCERVLSCAWMGTLFPQPAWSY